MTNLCIVYIDVDQSLALFLGRSLKSATQVSRLNLTTQYFLAMKTGWVETQVLSGTLLSGDLSGVLAIGPELTKTNAFCWAMPTPYAVDIFRFVSAKQCCYNHVRSCMQTARDARCSPSTMRRVLVRNTWHWFGVKFISTIRTGWTASRIRLIQFRDGSGL